MQLLGPNALVSFVIKIDVTMNPSHCKVKEVHQGANLQNYETCAQCLPGVIAGISWPKFIDNELDARDGDKKVKQIFIQPD
jgi:hypothetical protein